MKIILILVDGMRPDSLEGIEAAQKIIKASTYTMNAQTVVPSVTLPCIISLFHSVAPMRHGTTTNVYAPQVRPIRGLCEVLKGFGKECAIFYDWEEVRDVSRPNSIAHAAFYAGKRLGYDVTGKKLTDDLIDYAKSYKMDFAFLHLARTDWTGHKFGWMGEEYMTAMQGSWDNIERIITELSDEYAYVIVADHGGHDRTHGSEMPEDMTIPVILYGAPFERGKEIDGVNIIDIAPTVTTLLGAEPDDEWEGTSII